MTEGSIVGIDGKNGKELWSVPFPDEWHENITTPLWTGTHLIVSGTRQGTHAYTLAQTGGKWQATETWKNPRRRDVHELSGFWRRLDLRSFFKKERPVCCHGRKDRRGALGH